MVEVENRGNYGQSVDIWSLGTVLYNLITGKMPYVAKEYVQIKKLVLSNAQPKYNQKAWKQCSPDALALVQSMF